MSTLPPGPNGPADLELTRLIADTIADDTDPVPLFDLASTTAAAIFQGVGEDSPEDLRGRRPMTAQAKAEDEKEGVIALQTIAMAMLENEGEATEPLVRVWAEMIDDDLFRQRIRRELPARNRRLPDWVGRADEIRPRRAAAMVSPVLVEETIFVEISTAARSCTLAIAVDHSGSPVLEDAFITPTPFDTVMADIFSRDEIEVDRLDLSPADARARITEALEMSDQVLPPIETDTWPGTRALTEWMLRLMPAGGEGFNLREWTPEEIDAIVEDFAASSWAKELSDDELSHAQLLFEFQANYGNNDPLRWGGTFVDRLLRDLYPRKVMAPPDYLLTMPTTLAALVQYANERSGVSAGFTQNALDAITAGQADYIALVNGEEPIESTAELLRNMLAGELGAGLDDEDSEEADTGGWSRLDPIAFEAELAELKAMAAESIRERLIAVTGSQENLDDLTVEPLPREEFDATDLPDDVVEAIRPMLPTITATAVDFFGDAEMATVVFRILAEVARRDPAIFRRRFARPNLVAALFWIAGNNNEAFDLTDRNGVERSIKNLQDHLGVKTAPNQRAATLLSTLGRPGTGWGVELGDPRLLTSERRAEIIETRDWYEL